MFLALEGTARFAVPRISRIEGRTANECRAVLTPTEPGCRKVFVLGNSLLEEGVQFDRLRDGFGTSFDTRCWIVENAAYWGWLYGTHLLLAEGARPDVGVLLLSPQQAVSNEIRGDYFAHSMMPTSDLLPVTRTLQLHPTVAAGFLTARASAFDCVRSESRQVLPRRLMPDLPVLFSSLTFRQAPSVSQSDLQAIGAPRLLTVRKIAAASNGMALILPFHNGELAGSYFRDGLPVNGTGAARFMEALILEPRVATQSQMRGFDGKQ